MRKHPVRKFFGLTLLYSAIIVGIFVIQFKSNSVFSKSLGDLNFSISQIQTENNGTSLKNQIKVSFKGITFSADDKNPITAKDSNGNLRPLFLESYEELTDSVEFSFNGGAHIMFRQIQDEENSTALSILAVPPENCTEIFLPYKIAQTYSTENVSPANILSPDIRAGIALLLAAMSAKGTSTISNVGQIDRGYENIEHRLNALGAKITRR